VEDRAGGRVNVMAAMVAAVRTAAHDAMMLCDPRALPAKDAIRVLVVAKPFKAGGIVRKYCAKSLFHLVMSLAVATLP
jgi:hypothetical protein